MKKFLALLLSALLVSAIFAVPASALTWEDNQTMNGNNYVFDNAYGYVFNIEDVNGKIGGEDCTIITNVDAYKVANPNWAISVLLAPTSEANVYEVVLVVENPQSADNGLAKGINFDNGNICLIAHSSYSNPNGANWASKVAALALKAGDKITLEGIDLAAGTATNATATVQDDPNGPTEETKVTVEEKMLEALGEKPADAKLDYVISAPETYKAGDDITVTVTVKNITAEKGIHVAEFHLYYDNEKLLLTNDLDEDDNNALVCFEELPNKWENFSRVNNDGGENSEDGTVLPLNDGKIICSVLTDNPNVKFAVKDDDVLVFTFTFKALEDAEGDLGFVIPYAECEGSVNTDDGADIYAANGGYAVVHQPTTVKGKAATCTEDGITDGSVCSDCGKVFVAQEVIPALGHKDGEWDTTLEPTCTEKGSKDLHCAVCDVIIKTEEIAALGHKDGEWDTTLEPTCTEKGSKDLHCAVCDVVIKTEAIDAHGHDYQWVTTVEPTLDTEGEEENRCTHCGDVSETRKIAPLRKLGDVNGNGEVEKYDYILVKRSVMSTITLDENQSKAANVNGKDGVDKYDYILIKRHVMGTYTIEGTTKN